ncbi:MAG TPA: hypothetical protein VIH42_03835 [Thermoguttaceae bacterium]
MIETDQREAVKQEENIDLHVHYPFINKNSPQVLTTQRFLRRALLLAGRLP